VCHLAQTFQIHSQVNNFKKKGSYNCKVSKFENILYVEEWCFSLWGKIFQLGEFYSENEKKNTKKVCAVKGFFGHFLK